MFMKTWHSASSSNIEFPVLQQIEQIEELHHKNLQKTMKSINKNRDIVREHITNKNHYQNVVMKMK